MTLHNPIPQLYVPQLQKGESTAFSCLPHCNGMAINFENYHLEWQKKRLGFDYGSISDTVAPEQRDCCSHRSHKQSSKFNKTTGLHIFCKFFTGPVLLQLQNDLDWVTGRITAPGFPCHPQPSLSCLSWGTKAVCNSWALCSDEPGTTGAIPQTLLSSLTCCKGSLGSFLARHWLSITKPFAIYQH